MKLTCTLLNTGPSRVALDIWHDVLLFQDWRVGVCLLSSHRHRCFSLAGHKLPLCYSVLVWILSARNVLSYFSTRYRLRLASFVIWRLVFNLWTISWMPMVFKMMCHITRLHLSYAIVWVCRLRRGLFFAETVQVTWLKGDVAAFNTGVVKEAVLTVLSDRKNQSHAYLGSGYWRQ